MSYRAAQKAIAMINELVGVLQAKNDVGLMVIRKKLARSIKENEFLLSKECNLYTNFSIALKMRDVLEILESSQSIKTNLQDLFMLKQSILSERKPLKIAFIAHEFWLWPSFQSIWESCPKDAEKTIVVDIHESESQLSDEELMPYVEPYRQAGYSVRTVNDYDPALEQPDIVFYMKPHCGFRGCSEKFYINDMEKVTPFTVFVSCCLDVQGGELLQEYFYGEPFFYHVWRIIGYSRYYRDKMIERGYCNAENVVLIGHPKFDVSFTLGNQKNYVHKSWQKKIDHRKVVLWNSHFTIEPGLGVGTFLRWYKTIFGYFSNHDDIVLLWRPHPTFWQRIEELPDLEKNSIKSLIDQERNQPNVIVDDSGDYRYAFCMSDALISDAATFLVEYAALARPILYTVKPDGERVCNDDYLLGVCIAEREEDIVSFLNNFRSGNISSSEIQKNKQMFEKIFGECDGNVGIRIINYVLEEMENEIALSAKKWMALMKGDETHGME